MEYLGKIQFIHVLFVTFVFSVHSNLFPLSVSLLYSVLVPIVVLVGSNVIIMTSDKMISKSELNKYHLG